MSTAVAYPHIEQPANDSAHLKRLPRIRVSQIVVSYQTCGNSVEETVRQFPHLTPAEVHAAMLYYLDHQEEIDRELEQEELEFEEWKARHPQTELIQRLKAVREAMNAKEVMK